MTQNSQFEPRTILLAMDLESLLCVHSQQNNNNLRKIGDEYKFL